MNKACILLRGVTNHKPTAASETMKISEVVFDFPHPPPAFNCFLSNVVGKQWVASRQNFHCPTGMHTIRKGSLFGIVSRSCGAFQRAEEQWCLLISADVGSSHVWPKAPPGQSRASYKKKKKKIGVRTRLTVAVALFLFSSFYPIMLPLSSCCAALGWWLFYGERSHQAAAMATRATVWEL